MKIGQYRDAIFVFFPSFFWFNDVGQSRSQRLVLILWLVLIIEPRNTIMSIQ